MRRLEHRLHWQRSWSSGCHSCATFAFGCSPSAASSRPGSSHDIQMWTRIDGSNRTKGTECYERQARVLRFDISCVVDNLRVYRSGARPIGGAARECSGRVGKDCQQSHGSGSSAGACGTQGYFRDAGVEVQLETLGGPQDATVLIATGRLDAAVVGFTAATFNAIDQGLDIKIVASFGGVTPDYRPALMVRRDLLDSGGVTTLADLRGRRVASLGGASSAATYQITRALRDVGLDARDVELVNLSLADTVAAFSSGAIDAAYLPVPFSAQAEQLRVAGPLGGVHTDGAGPLTVGLLLRGEFARVSPGAARATMVALVRAARDLR